jgi:phenylacetate-coenzyme A ligase PaaK-like adenylate-forming protein
LLKNENIIFEIQTENDFHEHALRIFNYQFSNNKVYGEWVKALGVKPQNITSVADIPFLPIEMFKQFRVITGEEQTDFVTFRSSGTTSTNRAAHFVKDISIYESSFYKCFEKFYGPISNYCVLALLPNYIEQGESSLVYMCDKLIKASGNTQSGFFLNNTDELTGIIHKLKSGNQKVILLGVSYALLDLCEKGVNLSDNFIVMETGGMKGRRKELLKQELHEILKNGFRIKSIHSEYGMTELLSQAYSSDDGLFRSPPWMKFFTREVDDPLVLRNDSRTGGINVIDLANIYSCSFIATKDLGRIHDDGSLELMGRYDNSDVRGCNLMLEI